MIGRLDTYVTGTGFEITPVVGLVAAPFPLPLDPFEVAEVFEVPLAFILDPATTSVAPSALFERRRAGFFVLPYREPQHLGRHRGDAGQSRRGARRLRRP